MKKLIEVSFLERHDHIPAMIRFDFQEGAVQSAKTMYCSKEEGDLIMEKIQPPGGKE